MRRTLAPLLAIGLGAAGCGDSQVGGSDGAIGGEDGGVVGCRPECGAGLRCQGSVCMPEPTALWVMTVLSGTVSPKNAMGEAWDPFGGNPDPQVCLTIGGARNCTKSVDNTLAPTWNQALPPASATAFLGGITVEIEDHDPVGANDLICPKGVVPLRPEHFQSGIWMARCDEGGFTAALRPQ